MRSASRELFTHCESRWSPSPHSCTAERRACSLQALAYAVYISRLDWDAEARAAALHARLPAPGAAAALCAGEAACSAGACCDVEAPDRAQLDAAHCASARCQPALGQAQACCDAAPDQARICCDVEAPDQALRCCGSDAPAVVAVCVAASTAACEPHVPSQEHEPERARA